MFIYTHRHICIYVRIYMYICIYTYIEKEIFIHIHTHKGVPWRGIQGEPSGAWGCRKCGSRCARQPPAVGGEGDGYKVVEARMKGLTWNRLFLIADFPY